jgi:hypothetical protein
MSKGMSGREEHLANCLSNLLNMPVQIDNNMMGDWRIRAGQVCIGVSGQELFEMSRNDTNVHILAERLYKEIQHYESNRMKSFAMDYARGGLLQESPYNGDTIKIRKYEAFNKIDVPMPPPRQRKKSNKLLLLCRANNLQKG